MTDDFSTTLTVGRSADDVYAAIIDPRGWWSTHITGRTSSAGDVYFYDKGDIHFATIEVVESTPGTRVVWKVLRNHFKFTSDPTEWTGTSIVFDLLEENGDTTVRFTHVGLNPHEECFEICNVAWTFYVRQSLRNLILTGTGQPDDDPIQDPLALAAAG